MTLFFDTIWNAFTHRAPSAAQAYRIIDPKIERIDHVAFRTFNVGERRLRHLEAWLLDMGYEVTGEYDFETKHVRAKSYSNHKEKIPRIFLSELQVAKLSKPNQNIINHILLHTPVMPALFPWCTQWAKITKDQYESLLHESEYAAWVATNGLMPNHFATGCAQRISSVINQLGIHKFKIASSGGKVKGGPAMLLEQAATEADWISYFTEDGHRILVPSAYSEFTVRWPNANGTTFDAFVEPNANRIFESSDTHKERALCIIKPDAVARGLLTTLLTGLLEVGFTINKIHDARLSLTQARELYEQHSDKDFFAPLVQFMTSGPSYLLELEGLNCCAKLRQHIAEVRTNLAMSKRENVMHGSDSPEAGKREVEIFFS